MNVTDKEEIKKDPRDMIVNREVEVLEVRAEIAALEHGLEADEHEKLLRNKVYPDTIFELKSISSHETKNPRWGIS